MPTDAEQRPQPILSLRQVARSYDSAAPVLQGVSLDLHGGEFLVIMGRSGSGKSTLLNLMGLLDQPDSGQVIFQGQDMTACPESERAMVRRHAVGFVFQSFNLLDTLTVNDNLLLPLELLQVASDEARDRTRHWLSALDLNELGARYPAELSGGEQQRVAVARALIHKPDVILADEPTGNLDLETARDLVRRLDRLCREGGHALVMATHSHEVMGLADRVMEIREGRLVETPHE